MKGLDMFVELTQAEIREIKKALHLRAKYLLATGEKKYGMRLLGIYTRFLAYQALEAEKKEQNIV